MINNILKPLPIVGRNLPYGQILGRTYHNGILQAIRIKSYDKIQWIKVA